MIKNLNVQMWVNLIKQGANPQHIYKQVEMHCEALEAVKSQTTEVKEAINDTKAFMRELKRKYRMDF